jgi:cell wall-associated NlpC family hydrolase
MRMITPTLVVVFTLLLPLGAHAATANQGDEIENLFAEQALLTHIGQVRQTVSIKASELVVRAMGFLGVPYRRGGNSFETGLDCSGFVRAIYLQSIGLILPRRAEQQAAATQNIDKRDLQPGDLVFFNTMRRTFSHVGIYIGEGRFIHSPKPGAEVRVESMSVAYWNRRFDGARRVASGLDDSTTIASQVPALLPVSQQLQTQ